MYKQIMTMIASYRTSELPTLCRILASVLGGADGGMQAVSELRTENDKWQTREMCEMQPQHSGCHPRKTAKEETSELALGGGF